MPGLKLKYFVLNPCSKAVGDKHAYASRSAMRRYAVEIEDHDKQLAMELKEWANKEEVCERSLCGDDGGG